MNDCAESADSTELEHTWCVRLLNSSTIRLLTEPLIDPELGTVLSNRRYINHGSSNYRHDKHGNDHD